MWKRPLQKTPKEDPTLRSMFRRASSAADNTPICNRYSVSAAPSGGFLLIAGAVLSSHSFSNGCSFIVDWPAHLLLHNLGSVNYLVICTEQANIIHARAEVAHIKLGNVISEGL